MLFGVFGSDLSENVGVLLQNDARGSGFWSSCPESPESPPESAEVVSRSAVQVSPSRAPVGQDDGSLSKLPQMKVPESMPVSTCLHARKTQSLSPHKVRGNSICLSTALAAAMLCGLE